MSQNSPAGLHAAPNCIRRCKSRRTPLPRFGRGRFPVPAYSPLPNSPPALIPRHRPGAWLGPWAFCWRLASGALGIWYAPAARLPRAARRGSSGDGTGSRPRRCSVGPADADHKATEHLKAILSARASAAPSATDALRAVDAPALKALARTSPQMAADIQSGRRVLYRVYLLDYLAEDGDQVELFVDGVSWATVYLKNEGTSFLIPLNPLKPAQLKVLAKADGGGGGLPSGLVSSLGEAKTQTWTSAVLSSGRSSCNERIHSRQCTQSLAADPTAGGDGRAHGVDGPSGLNQLSVWFAPIVFLVCVVGMVVVIAWSLRAERIRKEGEHRVNYARLAATETDPLVPWLKDNLRGHDQFIEAIS